MNWWLMYLLIGFGLLCVALLVSKVQDMRKGSDKELSELKRALLKPSSRREWLTEKLLVPILAGVSVVVAWPLVSVWALKERMSEKHNEKERERRREEGIFRIKLESLTRAVSIEEVEQTESVFDPMCAVPPKPFGHLNAVWQEFLHKRPNDAELWAFECDWKTELGTLFARGGYVWVKDKVCAPWMLTTHISKEEQYD